ncbi:site-specific DNA-methyltransferase [Leclercia tamurae]|uniref:site-specific DNA-methyltransferase (adenine-specific) n=1 Tax=Leclercia tamurae TaxID=2926467 RepID=A0ABT2RBU2_9ENTR|nr:site-specific DNA-methyltransferase [Leclercia tamurae]MCU6678357.1 site-specific DNA-methyltransferase [Leclercia tamurae]
MQTELIKELNKVLKCFPDFWNGEELHRSMVSDAIRHKKPDLIKALIANEKIKSVYGTQIDDILIFDFDKLCSLFKYKEYWANSFTKYRNKIGLTSEGKYLDYSSDVVLDFPFKDCVLEGGMTKEEQGKEEVYYNEIIARDEIDRLFSPKIFSNVQKYESGVINKKLRKFNQNDNIIIKGNNLIALHSLKNRYSNSVKFIYIDPPYNTETDSFKYNDKFSHSTWLVFMKNRLEVAKDLLRDDGLIAINVDDNEVNYLGSLADDIFGRRNRIAIFPRVTKKGGKSTSIFAKNHDYVLLYVKNINNKCMYAVSHDDDNFKYKDEFFEERGTYKLNQTLDYDSLQYSKSLDYKIELNGGVYYPGGDVSLFEARALGHHNRADWAWRWSRELFEFGLENGFIEIRNGGARPRIYTKTYQNAKIIKEAKGYKVVSYDRTKALSTLEFTDNKYSNDNATKHISTLLDKNVFDYTKPESLLAKLIEITSARDDLILDFHLGSGTTAAAAHKMGRRYIGIEQMDYINDITIPRLQKVIEGEQGGISKDVSWQGGGSFVYAELMELNAYFVQEIQRAQSYEALKNLFCMMRTEAHLNYHVALENVLSTEYEVEGVLQTVAFNDLELHEQKRLLIETLDKNQLYVDASDMDDGDLNISESDKAFTRSFYSKD